MCARAETLGIIQFIKCMQFMLHQLYLKRSCYKMSEDKADGRGRCLGAFSDAPEILSRGPVT